MIGKNLRQNPTNKKASLREHFLSAKCAIISEGIAVIASLTAMSLEDMLKIYTHTTLSHFNIVSTVTAVCTSIYIFHEKQIQKDLWAKRIKENPLRSPKLKPYDLQLGTFFAVATAAHFTFIGAINFIENQAAEKENVANVQLSPKATKFFKLNENTQFPNLLNNATINMLHR